MSVLSKNWKAIQEGIQKVSKGREVAVVGATKFQPIEKIQEAVELGLRHLGANYVQDGDALRENLEKRIGNEKAATLQWHFIGHIQSRKAKDLVAYHCVQSLDRVSVAEELNRRAAAAGKVVEALIEINIGAEANKSGIAVQEFPAFLNASAAWSNLRIRGLMAMPPPLEPVEARRRYFVELRQNFEKYKDSHGLDTLSMGTSEDYLIAIEEGATMVRLGTVLFGSRS